MHLVIGTDVSETISILPRNLNRIADHSHSLLLVVICHDLSSFFWSFIRRNDGNEHAFTGLAAALAATAGGTLTSKQKIKLEAYIQMDYLDRILRHANLRLMQMTDAQYELERIGAENQRSQSGLDLGVIDHYNGTRRSVKTLSGGESFKASLALALGLSDEVQSAAGGIRLDTLFLDEGFGSLDEESLEQAIRVLAGLTEGDRLVGIISHVGALKDRIDRQVVVHKNRTGGSTVELVV